MKRSKSRRIFPAVLLVVFGVWLVWAEWNSGSGMSDLTLFGLVCALAGAVILAFAVARPRVSGRPILVDGSNVMHWRVGQPDIETVRIVLAALKTRGFSPGVMFDANVGYKIGNHYLDDRHLAKLLRLPEAQVLVVPKGTPADRFLLEAARDLGARIVTNDRFRDWADAHPEIREPGFLIRGGFAGDKLWLDAPEAQSAAA